MRTISWHLPTNSASDMFNRRTMSAVARGFALISIDACTSLGSAIGRGSTGWALFAQLATIVVLGAFLFFAIQSFRAARLAREADAANA